MKFTCQMYPNKMLCAAINLNLAVDVLRQSPYRNQIYIDAVSNATTHLVTSFANHFNSLKDKP